MITSGFAYVAVLLFLAAVLVYAEKKEMLRLFRWVPAVVLLYLLTMLLATLGLWDQAATAPAYRALKNNLTYAMIFAMLLRCDVRKLAGLGGKMILGFFAASVTIILGFLGTFALLKNPLGEDAWKGLGALCGSWLGGAGNMLAVQAALEISEAEMGYALLIDSVVYAVWLMFLLWAVTRADRFNRRIGAVPAAGRLPGAETKKAVPATFESLFLVLGAALLGSAAAQWAGEWLYRLLPFLDAGTWTVLTVTALGALAALSPLGRIGGTVEISGMLLYAVIPLLASRAGLTELSNAPVWIGAGFLILLIHAGLMLLCCRLFRLDLFTAALSSLANIGGTASAPVLAGAYSEDLVPAGILMALMGYLVGTPLGLLTAGLMEKMA